MGVYAVIEIEVIDRVMYAQYSRAVPEIVSRYGGRYLANTDEVIPLAGGWQPHKIVLPEFDTMQQLSECFGSMEYLGNNRPGEKRLWSGAVNPRNKGIDHHNFTPLRRR